MSQNNILAIIPARGGSKRLPRKNIIPFGGKPIICWTVESAIESQIFDNIIVSSEDDQILEVVQHYEITVQKRDPRLAKDESKVIDVCNDILKNHSSPDKFCVLYPTAPLRTAKDIRATVGLLDPPECDFSIAVTDYELPPHQALIEEQGFLKPKWPQLVNKRTNEIGRLLVDNGSTYACVTGSFLNKQTFYGNGLKGHFMSRENSIDLDTAEDLAYLEYIFLKREKGANVNQ